jgi:hydrogenase maturation protease
MKKTLVLGIGNLLLGDEGVGVHAARALWGNGCPRGVEVLEVGTAILDALPALENAEHVIVLDAMKCDGNPGTVYRIPLGKCRTSQCIASMHGFDIFRVLSLTGCKVPPEVLVLGIEPFYIGWSMELSPPVSNALPFLVETVKMEIKSWSGVDSNK